MTMPKPPAWTEHALCGSVDPELFHPDPSVNPWAARRICKACPVRTQCLTEALADPSLSGVWGGTTDRERMRLRGTPDGHRACRGCGGWIPKGKAMPMRCDDCRRDAA